MSYKNPPTPEDTVRGGTVADNVVSDDPYIYTVGMNRRPPEAQVPPTDPEAGNHGPAHAHKLIANNVVWNTPPQS